MKLEFTKMQGIGNDFVVLDGRRQSLQLDSDCLQQIADRRFGVGCDQILVLEKSNLPDVDVRYRIFNADGSEVEQCGNGARCIARYLHSNGLEHKTEIVAETAAGPITLYIELDDLVRVNMGVPRFAPADIPLAVAEQADSYNLSLEQGEFPFRAVSMGNPHAVLESGDVDTVPISVIAPMIQAHPLFPAGINVGFMQIEDREHIRLRVYERGAGETLACGSGACAAVVCGISAGLLDDCVNVDLPGGRLQIQWAGDDNPVWMTGPAEFVFQGTLELQT
ncbi:diaminopimelate epimerase [Methylohalomonas lacus]|uniref:Diaminopimelate epimerase n=1 Tax=Methylohalomonas lacus TaxID=398773 RepID=A0AAE3L1P9_9GAMM|nr:diaminopimelate epimerase [Methylohalomonas lacus]MCS3903925.1 diaminopimelate epimerase [Methylohalomonas lacus]